MQYFEPYFIECPSCGGKNKFPRFSVFGYEKTEWSDGKIFKTLPSTDLSKLQMCTLCKKYYWYDSYCGINSFDFYVEALKHFERKYSLMSFFSFINIFYYNYDYKLKNKKDLIYIRTNIMRTYNDQFRIHPLSKGKLPKNTNTVEKKKIFIDNAKKLIKLLNEINSDDLFLRAELYRNIGDFEEASRILNQLPDSNKKELLLKEIEKRNCDVIIINEITVPVPPKKTN